MPDELKSAVELALEKLEKEEGMSVEPLSPQQKEAVAEVRRRFQARIAEAEIASQSQVQQAAAEGNWERLEPLQQRLIEERRRLEGEMEKEVEKVKKS